MSKQKKPIAEHLVQMSIEAGRAAVADADDIFDLDDAGRAIIFAYGQKMFNDLALHGKEPSEEYFDAMSDWLDAFLSKSATAYADTVKMACMMIIVTSVVQLERAELHSAKWR